MGAGRMADREQERRDEQDHYFRVFVGGYVFPQLPLNSPEADVKAKAERMTEDGDLDVTQTVIEGEFDD